MLSNQIAILVVRGAVDEEIEVKELEMIPEVCEELGCNNWVYIPPHFIK